MTDLEQMQRDPVSRRAFLTRMTAAGLGVAAVALLGGEAAQASGKPVLELVNIPDNSNMPGIKGKTKTIQVLNYALALETLEADLYRQALNLAAGKPLDTPLPADTSSYTLAVGHGYLSPKNADLVSSTFSSSRPSRPRTGTTCGRSSPRSAASRSRRTPAATRPISAATSAPS